MGALVLQRRSALPTLSQFYSLDLREQDLQLVPVQRSALPSLLDAFPAKSERSLVVDGREVRIPPEVKRKMSVAALKSLAEIYRGLVVFMQEGNAWKRMKDSDVIDMEGKQNFQAREEVVPKSKPKFRSAPGFRLD